mmetsp:Transcript_15598/g.23626  ORF Transcript_15598/g.23626 Transcript_15598/m.23626 type:complete len:649 (-) Transcript_15598:403-2349(-)
MGSRRSGATERDSNRNDDVFFNEIGPSGKNETFVEVGYNIHTVDIEYYQIYIYHNGRVEDIQPLKVSTTSRVSSQDLGLSFVTVPSPPRAYALVHNTTNEVFDFWFIGDDDDTSSGVAMEGPAQGMNSLVLNTAAKRRQFDDKEEEDTEVLGGKAVVVCMSYSLTGSGCRFEDFRVQETLCTPGSFNIGQYISCTPTPPVAPAYFGHSPSVTEDVTSPSSSIIVTPSMSPTTRLLRSDLPSFIPSPAISPTARNPKPSLRPSIRPTSINVPLSAVEDESSDSYIGSLVGFIIPFVIFFAIIVCYFGCVFFKDYNNNAADEPPPPPVNDDDDEIERREPNLYVIPPTALLHSNTSSDIEKKNDSTKDPELAAGVPLSISIQLEDDDSRVNIKPTNATPSSIGPDFLNDTGDRSSSRILSTSMMNHSDMIPKHDHLDDENQHSKWKVNISHAMILAADRFVIESLVKNSSSSDKNDGPNQDDQHRIKDDDDDGSVCFTAIENDSAMNLSRILKEGDDKNTDDDEDAIASPLEDLSLSSILMEDDDDMWMDNTPLALSSSCSDLESNPPLFTVVKPENHDNEEIEEEEPASPLRRDMIVCVTTMPSNVLSPIRREDSDSNILNDTTQDTWEEEDRPLDSSWELEDKEVGVS